MSIQLFATSTTKRLKSLKKKEGNKFSDESWKNCQSPNGQAIENVFTDFNCENPSFYCHVNCVGIEYHRKICNKRGYRLRYEKNIERSQYQARNQVIVESNRNRTIQTVFRFCELAQSVNNVIFPGSHSVTYLCK